MRNRGLVHVIVIIAFVFACLALTIGPATAQLPPAKPVNQQTGDQKKKSPQRQSGGGRAFFPTDMGETPAIAAQIDKDLRAQYVISYYPNNDRRNAVFHTVRVVVDHGDNRKLIARTRQGYYAHNDKGTSQGAGEKRLE